MYCPKCNYTSFDHLPNCPKCAYDWSEQKRTFNMEWIVPTATEGMNIFTPVSPGGQAQTEQSEAQPQGVPGSQSAGRFAAASNTVSQGSQESAGAGEEIDLVEADLLEDQGEQAMAPSGDERSAGHEDENEPGVEVDEEISFDGLEDFSVNLTEESPTSSPEATEEAADSSSTAAEGQEPDLEIEIEDQSPAAEEEAPAMNQEEAKDEAEDEALTMDEDELDLDITSILDDLENDSEQDGSRDKKRS